MHCQSVYIVALSHMQYSLYLKLYHMHLNDRKSHFINHLLLVDIPAYTERGREAARQSGREAASQARSRWTDKGRQAREGRETNQTHSN